MSALSKGDDSRLNFLQRMIALIAVVVLILSLAYFKNLILKPAIKYCPNGPDGLDSNQIQIIN